MKITRIEDVEAWKAARRLTNLTYVVTEAKPFDRDFELRRQMRGCAVSAMANIAEGFDSGSDPEFRRFLKIARRSVTELQSHLYVALDRRYLEQERFHHIYAQTRDVKSLVGGFLRHLKKPRTPT
jgi:four helix bundle protein